MNKYDVAVIGGGMSGLMAATDAAARGASVVCFEPAGLFGGLVANVGRLDDYPSPTPIAGGVLADHLLARARQLGVTFVPEGVTALDAADGDPRLVAGGVNYRPKTVIIASGARLRQLDVPGEKELAGRGVSYCDWCDGGLYRGQQVAVVGGGCAAVQAALHLAELCESVTLVVRGSSLRARRDYVLRAADSDRITFSWDSVVESVLGQDGVEGLRLRNVGDGSHVDLPCTGAFIFAGLVPNTAFVDGAIGRDAQGFIITDASYRTSNGNMFAVGAARSGSRGAVLTAMAEAASAAATAVEQLDREAMP